MGERDRWFDRMRARFKLEHGLLLGGGIAFAGLAVGSFIVIDWINRGFGALAEERLAVLAATLIIVGIQIFFSSFLLSILGLRRSDRTQARTAVPIHVPPAGPPQRNGRAGTLATATIGSGAKN